MARYFKLTEGGERLTCSIVPKIVRKQPVQEVLELINRKLELEQALNKARDMSISDMWSISNEIDCLANKIGEKVND